MKKNFLILLVTILIYSCNQSSNSELSELKLDQDFGFDNKKMGVFVGEFVGLNKQNSSTTYTFKNGKGETCNLFYIKNLEGNLSESFFNMDNQKTYYPNSNSLKDSIDNNPDLFVGRLIKVEWSSFSHFENEKTPTDEQYANSQIGGGYYNVSITFWKENVLLSMSNNYNKTLTDKTIKPDEDFGIEQKTEGEFIGEFSKFSGGMWNTLTFKNGKGGSIEISDITSTELSYNNFYKSSLLDSIRSFPENFVGKLLKIKWGKFQNENPPENIPDGKTPVLVSVSHLNEKINGNTENINKEQHNNLTTENTSSNLNNKSFGEIRGLVISGKRNTVIDVLGEPKEKLLGSVYSEKYLHFKLGMVHELRLMDYLVWVYNISGNELLVVFDKTDKVCKVVYSKDIKQPYDLTE